MIKRITIKNFRSLKDVTVDLQDVNLFIGPNNSGKSNFFKALEFLRDVQTYNRNYSSSGDSIDRAEVCLNNTFGKIGKGTIDFIINFALESSTLIYKLEIFNYEGGEYRFNEFLGTHTEPINTLNINLSDKQFLEEHFTAFLINVSETPSLLKKIYAPENTQNSNSYSISYNQNKRYEFVNLINMRNKDLFSTNYFRLDHILNQSILEVIELVATTRYYHIDPNSFKSYQPLTLDKFVKQDASNLVAFLDNLRDSNPDILDNLLKDLKICLKEFEGIRFEKGAVYDGNEVRYELHKRIGLSDKQNTTYWSDELSDGVLYFLALLAIVHQPNPPKLIMLEEPEKGIHPRRIHEVIDYIFQLAESKGIQVILSSHSTYVVDESKDIPEAVFVFDKEGAETQIKNLQTDIIEPSDKKSDEAGLPHINYTKSLGDHWAVGLIGGVPK